MNWKDLRRDLPVTLILATLGVLLATAVTAAGVHFLLGWEWQPAILLGVLISATDPVSVIATFKEAGVEGRLRLLVETESLFNDGTAAVLFAIALTFRSGSTLFVINSLIFLLIGVQLTHQHFSEVWVPIVAVIPLALLGRAVAVYGCCLPFARSRWRVDKKDQHILVWGGLRGALALVFGLPSEAPYRAAVVTVVFAVVAFSVIVQGVSMPHLLRRMGALPS